MWTARHNFSADFLQHFHFSNRLSLATTLEEICRIACRETLSGIPAKRFYVALLFPQEEGLHFCYGYEDGTEVTLSKNPPHPAIDKFISNIVQTNEMLHRINSEGELDGNHPSSRISADFCVWLGLPMMVSNVFIGVLFLESDAQFSKDEIEWLTAVAGTMAVAINNLLKLEAVQVALKNQSEQRQQLQTAAEIAATATTILDQSQLIREIVELIRARFKFIFVGLFLVDEDGETAVLQGGSDHIGRELVARGHNYSLSRESIISLAINNGQAQVVQNVQSTTLPQFNPIQPETQAALAIPMHTHGLITGAILFESAETGFFDDETISVLQTLGDQIAAAIMNARLFTHAQGNLDKTNRLYEASRNINEAASPDDVYQALVNYSKSSNLVDAAYIITNAPDYPNSLSIPILWHRFLARHNEQDHFPRDKFRFSAEISHRKFSLIKNSQTDERLSPLARRLSRENNLRALALIPLKVEDEWLATLALQRINPHLFTETDLKPFFTLVDQSAIILSNQQLLNQAKILYQVGKELSRALTPDDAHNTAVQWVAKHTGAAQCRIVLYDEKAGFGTIIAEVVPTEFSKTVRFPTHNDFAFNYLSKNFKPLLLDKYSDAPPECYHQYVHTFGAKSSLLFPATSQQELIGFMALDSEHEERPFTQTNIIFAQTVVDHLTTQIENLTLLEETLNRAQELITLNQIQSGISGVLDLTGLAQTVYEQVGRLLDNSIFILARYYDSSNYLEPILYVINENTIPGIPRRIQDDEPLYQFLFGLKPIITDKNHPILEPSLIPGLGEKPLSSLWMPLLQENKPTGFISLQSHIPDCYTETDIQLLRSIATHTDLAIANAHFFEEIQASNEQLRQLDHLKTQFLANMSHELRTPLNSIIGFSRVMLKGIDGPLTQAQEEDLTSIFNNGQHLLSLINEILDMAKINAGKMAVSYEMVNLEHAVQMAMDTARSLVNEESVSLTSHIDPHLPQIEGDPVRIRQILNNLLSNAAKFTREGYIRLIVQQQNDEAHLIVEDTGIGIHDKDSDLIFKPFEQIGNPASASTGGTGLGLPITKWLIKMHNGRIHLDSQPGKGSTFHVYLPIRQPTEPLPEISMSNSLLAFNKDT